MYPPSRCKKSVPILIRGEIVDYIDKRGYPCNQYMDYDRIGDISIYNFRKFGSIKLKCRSFHTFQFPGIVTDHFHLCDVGGEFDDINRGVNTVGMSFISLLPKVCSRSYIERILAETSECNDNLEFIDIMEYYPGVRVYKEWYLIESNANDISHIDMCQLNKESKECGLSIMKYLMKIFNVDILWRIKNNLKIFCINHMCTND